VASILLLDPSGTRLVHGAAPRLPEAYNRAIDGLTIGPRAGSCGTAAFRGERVLVTDIQSDPLWTDYPELAAMLELRSCWSSPILASDSRVLGTFALYHREAREPDAACVALIDRATHVASIAIERRQLDDQLRALSDRLEAIREEERTGIAREIHDQLGQALTALKLDIAWLARRLPGAPGPVAAKIAEMTGSADELLGAIRRISAELRPGILDDVGVLAAIEWQAEEFARRTGVPCRVHSDLGDLQLDRDLATATFRIFQEALTNVARHASATAVEVDLRLDRGNLRLQISDDGTGLPDSGRRSGLGLLGMRERARRLGGECVIRDREPRGTAVSLVIPIRFPARTDESASLTERL
jgi:signal transduction histidine kinase